MQNNKTVITSVIILLLLIGLVTFLVLTRGSKENVDIAPTDDSTFTSVSGDENNSIIVNDQIPGNVLFYRNLTLLKDGFVVVRNDKAGKPGDIIGSKFVKAGEDTTGNVELDESTIEGGVYYVQLYTDIDSSGTFDELIDTQILTSGGKAIQQQIKTTVDLPELKG